MKDKTIVLQFLNILIHLGQGKRKKILSVENGVLNVFGVIFLKNENTYFSIITAVRILPNFIIHIPHQITYFFIRIQSSLLLSTSQNCHNTEHLRESFLCAEC